MVCTICLRAHDLARCETSIQGVFTGRLPWWRSGFRSFGVLRENAGVAWSRFVARVVDGDLTVKTDGGTADQGLLVFDAGGVDGVAGYEIVGPVQHHSGFCHQTVEQGRVGTLQDGADLHIGLELRNFLLR